MLRKVDRAAPPSHLGPGGKRLWSAIMAEYLVSDAAGLELLRAAAEARDTLDDAAEAIRKHGALIPSANGGFKANPAGALQRDARSGMLQALKALHLDLEPVKAVGRPPGQRR